ncbi:trans-sialidase, putative, partial [Trypanosoma cruzi]
MNAEYQGAQLIKPLSSGVVAGCIDSVWNWSTVVGEVNKGYIDGTHCGLCSGGKGEFGCCAPPHNNHEGPRSVSSCGRLGCALRRCVLERGRLGAETVVGDVANPTGGRRSEWIEWGDLKPLPKLISSASHEGERTEFIASGGAGVVVEDGTLVFPLMAV